MRKFRLATGTLIPDVPKYSESTYNDVNTTTTTTTTGTTTTSTSSTLCRNSFGMVVDSERSEEEKTLDTVRADMHMIREQYADSMGKTMPLSIASEVYRDLANGTDVAYYLYAIKETAKAPNPSWRYTMAILNRLHREKVEPLLLLLD